ncbi:preprotein translocase subunit SecY [Buchnera aphidicola (Thelaxes californica)]|uniref:Protein translocase subunit SecY n=1 Tax=Buchnera aphidicola (Thelaxes californica) TaxID=1315998 RepID=A0A4D6YMD6_9GAMM|nr:preprotein translocase subunit SecY [Buchnera aphidicola]QCI26908.1 preprotein translocase subunit SecY [Buchnera aphidicola (Thelaxes californica)]
MKKKINIKNNKSKFSELINRIFFVIGALIIFRIGSFIPIPGINTAILSQLLKSKTGTIIEIFNVFSGGALSRASIFALGIMPYISASIIVQLLTFIYPYFSDLKKMGSIGNNKINQYIRYITLLLSLLQSIGLSFGLPNIPGIQGLIIKVDFNFYFTSILSLTAGTMFLMWLGEMITEKGIGNGTSLIIFSGIVSGLPNAVMNTINTIKIGVLDNFFLFLICISIVSIIYLVVFIEKSQRKILVQYPRRHQGRKLYAAQETYLPMKINISGVMPAIFTSSIMLFPSTFISFFNGIKNWKYLVIVSQFFFPGNALYTFVYVFSIVFFCFFYTDLLFNPMETANNLKKSGAFIPGIRPGVKTAEKINMITSKLTCIGSMYITFICLLPEMLRIILKVPFYFGGTSLLIVVVVIIEFISQVQTLIMSTQYASIMKKSNLYFGKNI